MVIGPVRACSNQDPSLRAGVCNGPDKDGRNWNPWSEGRSGDSSGDRWKNDEGADSSLLVAMVRCVGPKYKLDSRGLYLGRISSGATMTNRALVFRSDFWEGGMSISGEWCTTRDDGSFLSFQDSREALRAAPAKIHQGRVAAFPLPATLGAKVVIAVWGGEKDLWDCVPRLVSAHIIIRAPRRVQTTSIRIPMSSISPVRFSWPYVAASEHARPSIYGR
jgi:hypothetical protein